MHCQAIIKSRHVDVIEMDAASHTGIDDVREIIESARYKPVITARKSISSTKCTCFPNRLLMAF